MSKVSWIDKKIKETLAMGEEEIQFDYSHLEKVKSRLRSNDMDVNMKLNFRVKPFRLSAVTTILMILFVGVLGVAAATFVRTDNINYKFKDDPRVIGKWQSVDYVDTIGEFSPGEKAWGDLYLKELVFIKDGKMLDSINPGNGALAVSVTTWTKGKIINPVDKTASNYEIKDINGEQYMFSEWKSGDYVLGGMQPGYYVLKKVDAADYSILEIPRIVDDINLSFVDDPEVSGSWKLVDFVATIDRFEPGKKSWMPDIFLTGYTFKADGKLESHSAEGSIDGGDIVKWTKGFVFNTQEQYASAYTVKKINGKEYMFLECKNDDYSVRGMQPYYYVLEKE